VKRSEALNLIWEAINELEDADHILKRLEDAGMLPPSIEVSYGKLGSCLENEWEPEDG
jgi:hypothetical protein